MELLTNSTLLTLIKALSALFIFLMGLAALLVLAVFIRDVTQHRHAITRNYPVIGHFRYGLEFLGRFLRQYLFAMDREELPFNRAERSWVYSSAKDEDSTAAFGSTKDIRQPGTILFSNCPFPTLGEDSTPPRPVTVGPHCPRPYTTDRFFHISGMSYGALSQPAVRALSKGAGMAGCWLNTGEGGLSPYHLEGDCDIVFQIGTAKYGVRDPAGNLDDDRLREVAAHEQVRMFEIKLSQGAKPGKGGILPAVKVTDEVARIRNIPAGTDSISPNRHPDINSIADMLAQVNHVRTVTGKPVGIKLVLGDPDWVDRLAAEIREHGEAAAPDFITVDGAEGGTGAGPMSLMDNMGLPRIEALPALVAGLERHGLRDRIRVIASGKMVTPEGVAWGLALGADFVVSARGFMFALGCIQSLRCNKDTCPTGITTHNPRLQKGLDPADKGVRVDNYVRNLTREVGVIAHACGVADPRRLKPKHVRLVTAAGRSVSWAELVKDGGA